MVYLAALSLILLTHNAVEAIIGGKPATKHEIAHLISLRDIVADKQFGQGHYCGGALYLEKFILTSAICISDFKWVLIYFMGNSDNQNCSDFCFYKERKTYGPWIGEGGGRST